MEYYYLDKTGQPAGPIPEALLRALRSAKGIHDKTLVTQVGGTEWHAYEAFFGRAASTSPQGKMLAIIGVAVLASLLLAGGGVWAILSSGLVPIGGNRSSDGSSIAALPPTVREPAVNPILPPVDGVPKQATLGGLDPAITATSAPAEAATGQGLAAVDDPLGEWYEFGFNIGHEAARSYALMEVKAEPSEAQLAQVFRNLGLESDSVPPQAMRVTFDGFRDGFGDSPAKLRAPQTQAESRLPPELQLYTALKSTEVVATRASTSHLEHTQACTLRISVTRPDGPGGQGTGFYVAPGLVATNRHVVEGSESIHLLDYEGQTHLGTVAAESELYDLALVWIDHDRHPVMKVRSTKSLRVGDDVTVVGFPVFELESATTNFGRISNTDRLFDGNPCFQVDMTINHGNSGGPVTDANGHVIGVATFMLFDMNIDRFNFAIKADVLLALIRDHTR